MRLDAPPTSDAATAEQLAGESAQRYGRDALDVELDLQAAAERVYGPQGQVRPDGAHPVPTEPDPNASGAVSASRASLGAHVPRRGRRHGEKGSADESRPEVPGRQPVRNPARKGRRHMRDWRR